MKYCLSFLVAMLSAAPAAAGNPQVASPDGRANVTFALEAGTLRYSVQWKGKTVVQPSAISVADAPVTGMTADAATERDTTWKPVWGQWSQLRDHYRELRLKLAGTRQAVLVCRAYDDGIAMRFVLPAPTPDVNFRCEYRLDPAARLWWPPRGLEPVGPVTLGQAGGKRRAPAVPVVVDFGPAGYGAILESDLYSTPSFESMRIRAESCLITESSASAPTALTPWRVILLGDGPADLLMSTLTLNAAAPCKLADTSWIKPGKAVWDWRVHGYRAADGFVYGIDTASYKRFIEFAAKNNIQHLLIDDLWYATAAPGHFAVRPEVDLPEVMRFAKQKGVGVLLYYDRRKGNFGDDALFADYARRGAVGIKYGFMGNRAAFTRSSIDAAAAHHLTIDFHDGPTPMTGVERTMPNLLAREYCHSQEDARTAFGAEAFLGMAAVNALVGPLDQDNGNFGLDGINRGERRFGPRRRGSYTSTVVSECARVLIVASGLICLPDAPEEYAKKADLFEFIREMPPATWDDLRVMNCRMGEGITTARRSGRQWFVGSVVGAKGGELAIPLDFLDKDTPYRATFYEDVVPSQGPVAMEAYRVRQAAVRRGDVVTARCAPDGGHGIWLRPASP